MAMADVRPVATPKPTRAVSTNVERNVQMTLSTVERAREEWNRIIGQIINWSVDPDNLQDDGIDAPSAAALSNSLLLATHLRDISAPPPKRVVADANGNVVFELFDSSSHESLSVSDLPIVEHLTFRRDELVTRESWDISQLASGQ